MTVKALCRNTFRPIPGHRSSSVLNNSLSEVGAGRLRVSRLLTNVEAEAKRRRVHFPVRISGCGGGDGWVDGAVIVLAGFAASGGLLAVVFDEGVAGATVFGVGSMFLGC